MKPTTEVHHPPALGLTPTQARAKGFPPSLTSFASVKPAFNLQSAVSGFWSLGQLSTFYFLLSALLPSALRLRGELGVLRRQLQDYQRTLKEPGTALSEGVPPEQINQLSTRGKAVCERLKTLHDRLRGSGPDPDTLLQAIRTSGIHDHLLDTFQVQRTTAAEALKSPKLNPPDAENLLALIAEADKNIKTRLDGYLLGLEVRTASLNTALDEMQGVSGEERLRFISDLEQAVRSAEDLVGKSDPLTDPNPSTPP